MQVVKQIDNKPTETIPVNALPGQFIAETFDSNMNMFNDNSNGSTTIAYQNVDKDTITWHFISK